jgi:hypothetical protein
VNKKKRKDWWELPVVGLGYFLGISDHLPGGTEEILSAAGRTAVLEPNFEKGTSQIRVFF